MCTSQGPYLSSGCFSTGRRCTLQDTKLGIRWYSCCGSLVRAMFDVSHFLTWEHGVSTNREVKRMQTHTLQTRSGVTSTWPLWRYMYFFFFSLLCKGRMALKWGWGIEGSFIHLAHTHTHIHLPHRPFIFTLTGISCSVSLAEEKEGEGERGREAEEGCQGRSEKGGWRRRKKTASDSSFLFHAKPSTDLPHLLLSGERVKRAQLLCTVILVSSSSTLPLFNCILRILLILLLLGHINTHPLPPHSSCVHPSPPPWGLPQWVGSSLSVCWWLHLEQMWCSAAVSLLCSTLPTPHTTSPPSYLPTLTSLCLPLQCLLCSYLSTCLFVPTLLKRKLASLILLSDVFFCFFLPSSSLTSLSNLLHFPAFLDAAVNVQST